jgi:hypothetical protein
MTTLTKTHSHAHLRTASYSGTSRYELLLKKLEFSYFGIISLAIFFGSCLGAIATMKVFENNAPMWQFIIALAFTMANLVACIGQATLRWVLFLFGSSLLINAALILINLI